MSENKIPGDPEMQEQVRQVLLVEYAKAQDSAEHHDRIVWLSTGITWAGMLVLLGFVLRSLRDPQLQIPITLLSFIGIFLVWFQWVVQGLSRSVKNQKYERCRDIEKLLDMHAHRNVIYPDNIQTLLYRTLMLLFILSWIIVLWIEWIPRLRVWVCS